MAVNHPAEQNIVSGVVGGIKFGAERGMLVDGDLTSLAAAKAAVDSDQNTKHVAEATFGTRIKASLDKADNYQSGYTSAGNVENIDTISDAADKGRHLRF